MKRTLSHQCPECGRYSSFTFHLPILTKRGFSRLLAHAAIWSLENSEHVVDHANERVQLFLDAEKREGEFLREEAKRSEYTQFD